MPGFKFHASSVIDGQSWFSTWWDLELPGRHTSGCVYEDVFKQTSWTGKIHHERSLPIPWARVQDRIRQKWTKGHNKDVYFLTADAEWAIHLPHLSSCLSCRDGLEHTPPAQTINQRNLSFLKLLFGVFCYSTAGVANTGCILHSILCWTCLSDPPGHTRFLIAGIRESTESQSATSTLWREGPRRARKQFYNI